MQLNIEQQDIFTKIIDNIKDQHESGAFDANYILITGSAGTGKSYLSSALVKYFQDNPISKYSTRCTALTHKALNELMKKLKTSGVQLDKLNGVSTVHSYFKIKAKINFKTGIEEFAVDNYGPSPEKCSILFIDEASMLDESLFNLIKSQRHLYETIVLIGDEFQVPPINDSNYNLFQDTNIHKFRLNKVVRQAQHNPIISLAQEIVHKIETKDYKNPSFCIKKIIEYSKYDEIDIVENIPEFIQSYYDYVKEDIDKPMLESKFYDSFFTTFTNKKVDTFNYYAKSIYKQSNNINYIDIYDLLVLQTPAFDPYLPDIIIAQNNSEIIAQKVTEDTYEGIGIYIVEFENNKTENFIRVVKPECEYMLQEKLEELKQNAKINGKLWKNFYDFKKKFTEIKQCFACTTHKSQGSTVDKVFLDLTDLPWSKDIDLAFRLCYVGITRTSNTATVLI